MDTMSCLQEQNKGADTERYGTEKLSPLLPEMQAGKFNNGKTVTYIHLQNILPPITEKKTILM